MAGNGVTTNPAQTTVTAESGSAIVVEGKGLGTDPLTRVTLEWMVGNDLQQWLFTDVRAERMAIQKVTSTTTDHTVNDGTTLSIGPVSQNNTIIPMTFAAKFESLQGGYYEPSATVTETDTPPGTPASVSKVAFTSNDGATLTITYLAKRS